MLGTGSIGTVVAKIGKSFGMKVLGFNRQGLTKLNFDQITDAITVLKQSDVISIHLPLNAETKGFIDTKKLHYIKKSAIIVNTATEKIVDKNAILKGIKTGKIYGYGIDVDELDSNDLYLQFPNVIVNIHNAFNSKEAKFRMQHLAINNIEAFIAGEPINLIET